MNVLLNSSQITFSKRLAEQVLSDFDSDSEEYEAKKPDAINEISQLIRSTSGI